MFVRRMVMQQKATLWWSEFHAADQARPGFTSSVLFSSLLSNRGYTANQAGAGYPANGNISQDGSGATLSCVNNVWTSCGSLKQRDCFQTGNRGGRDFSEHRCPTGYCAVGLTFAGPNGNESSYVITCSHWFLRKASGQEIEPLAVNSSLTRKLWPLFEFYVAA